MGERIQWPKARGLRNFIIYAYTLISWGGK